MKLSSARLAKIAGDFLKATEKDYKEAFAATPRLFIREVKAMAGSVLTQYEKSKGVNPEMCFKPKGGKKGGKGGKGK